MSKTVKTKSKSSSLRYEYANFYYTKNGRCTGRSTTMYKEPEDALADSIIGPGEVRKVRRRLVGKWEDVQ